MALVRVALFVTLTAAGVRAETENEVVVFAATSLREAFGQIAEGFEKDHGGARVVLNLAGSPELVTQIENGALADVFASADKAQMSRLEQSRLVTAPQVFAANEPVIVAPPGNPAKIKTLQDLPRASRIVLGGPEVPIGRY